MRKLALAASAAALVAGLGVVELALPGAQVVSMQRLSFECDTDEQCAATPPCAKKPGCDGSPYTEPYALVGYDCVGAVTPLYRDEEDEFPRCGEIIPTWAVDHG